MGSAIVVIAALFLRSVLGQSSSAVSPCQALADVVSICEIMTPSFTNLPASEQAGCVCASTLGTIQWGPASFDGLASACATADASVNPTVASAANELSGLCTSYAVQGPSAVASSIPSATVYISRMTPQVSENPAPSNTGGLYNISPGSSPNTAFSLQTASQATTTNAAVRMHRQCQGVMELGLAVGGMAIGGYIMA